HGSDALSVLHTNKSARGVLFAPPMSNAARVFGPKAAVKGMFTGLLEAVALEASTRVIWFASVEANTNASRLVASNFPMVNPATSLLPLGRQSTHENTPL